MTPSFVSWFSGVGMFDLALIRAGFERLGACEIDKFARKVYAARLGAPAFFSEDITSVEAKDIPDADLWIGGFPCQDVSVAGKRAGIGDGDTRSGLVHTFLRLAVAKRPRFLLLENVPGLLSGTTAADDGGSAGDVERDEMGEPAGDALWFGALLGALAESGYRHGAWRILDARWFGVAQRRRRVFLLFARDPRDGAVARAVLSEFESVRRGPPTRGEARPGAAAGARGGLAGLGKQRVARALRSKANLAHREDADTLVAATLTSGGHPNSNAPGRRAEDDVNLVAATLTAGGRETGPHGALDGVNLVAATLNASYDRGAVGHNRDENLVPVAFDRAQVTHPANRSRCEPGAPMPTLHAGGGAFVAFASNTRSEVRDLGDLAGALPSQPGMNQQTFIASILEAGARCGTKSDKRDGLGVSGPDAPMFTLQASHQHAVAFSAFAIQDAREIAKDQNGLGVAQDIAYTLDTTGAQGVATCGNGRDALDTTAPGAVFAVHATQDPISSRDVSPCLGTGSKQGTATTAVNAGPAVRRLTPMECELLQGLPRGWTCLCGVAPYSTAACKCPDGPRYRAIGNGGAVPVVNWIGRRLLARIGGDLT